jgi:hypothetical protein
VETLQDAVLPVSRHLAPIAVEAGVAAGALR